MKTLAQDSTNDIYTDSRGVLATVSGVQSYADIIANELRTLSGEILLEPTRGVDYMGTVFKSSSRTHIWKYYATQAVEALDFVNGVVSFDVEFTDSGKKISYSLTVSTDKGEVDVTG